MFFTASAAAGTRVNIRARDRLPEVIGDNAVVYLDRTAAATNGRHMKPTDG